MTGHCRTGRSAGRTIVLSADPPRAALPYADHVSIEAVRGLWSEPRAPDAEGPRPHDWALTAVVTVVAVIETVARDDLTWRTPSLVVALVAAVLLPWRRVQPLVVTVIAIGLASAVDFVALARDVEWDGLGTGVFFLLFPYSLGRWASGRELVAGMAVFAFPLTLAALAGDPVDEVVGGAAIVLLAGALGAGIRYKGLSQQQELDSIRSRERADLARELHDSVAHHVSAIAIQAQAGRALVGADPAAAADALAVIEEQASRTLEEMRAMVGTLRQGDSADLAPQQGVHDIARLAAANGSGPPVSLELSGDLDSLRPSVDAALYRLAQEAITNARRHARHATAVTVEVVGEHDRVHLTVTDDGAGGGSTPGFGLTGMAERVKLLGGTFSAGPRPEGGWMVDAALPRHGVTR